MHIQFLPSATKFAKVMVLQVSVCPQGGVHGCQGACVVAGGHAWLWGGVCMVWGVCVTAGGVHGCQGVCMVAGGVCVVAGGMHDCWGHVWLWGVCMVAGRHAWLQGCV